MGLAASDGFNVQRDAALSIADHRQVGMLAVAESCSVVVTALPSVSTDRSKLEDIYERVPLAVVGYEATDGSQILEILEYGQVLRQSRVLSGPAPVITAGADTLIRRLSERVVDRYLILAGSELNIVRLTKTPRYVYSPPIALLQAIERYNIRAILNPSTSYMRRWEMKEKRRFLSGPGRAVVSVWNKTTGSEARDPWTVFEEGHQIKPSAITIKHPDGLVFGVTTLRITDAEDGND